MLDFSDGSFMLPLRIVQLVTSLIGMPPPIGESSSNDVTVLVCSIAGHVNLPNFVSPIGSPAIMLSSVLVFPATWLTLVNYSCVYYRHHYIHILRF